MNLPYDQSTQSKSSHEIKIDNGRGRGARTPDLRFWRPPLYQLSYTPSQIRLRTGCFIRFCGASFKTAPDNWQAHFLNFLCFLNVNRKALDTHRLATHIKAPSRGQNLTNAVHSAH